MDQLTREITEFIAGDIRPTKDARWQGLILTLLDEIRRYMAPDDVSPKKL